MALQDQLVSYWSLDEASGNAIDSHGSNNLTDLNTVGSATGKIGNARDFEADNLEQLYCADTASLSGGNTDFTIAAWVKAESLPAGNHTIVAKYNVTGNQREYWLRYDSGTFTLLVSSDGSTTTTRRASTFGIATVGNWYYVVAWHDSVNDLIGLSINNSTPETVAHTTGVFDGTGEFCIGSRNPAATVDFWDGLIDEAGFWRRVLTPAERTDLYNAGAGRDYAYIRGNRRRRLICAGDN